MTVSFSRAGAIEVNGDGLMLVTEEWLLSDVQVRNPGLTRETTSGSLPSGSAFADDLAW
jgi:agmatine/peptidylarginine deiminase